MGKRRQADISKSIHRALLREPDRERKTTLISGFIAFFAIWKIRLARISAEIFRQLRNNVWQIDEDDYKASFLSPIQPVGDLGFSGSTFFRTENSKLLIKSLPRHSEYSFFRDDFLRPYYNYMQENQDSLLVRITDFLGSQHPAIGTILKCTPSHHVIMENILHDRQNDPNADRWETYDLKPVSYFYPERDLLPDPLTPKDATSKLFDVFEDKIRITKDEHRELRKTIESDLAFLQSMNAVDYSLFLVRYPAEGIPPTSIGRGSRWRHGVRSADGRWRYRVVLLDFFWAKHKLQAQAMTGVIQTFNVVGRQGPMSITTTAEEYRDKFLRMVDGIVELRD